MTPIENLITAGVGYRIHSHDILIVAFAYAVPSDGTLRDQYGFELQYRVFVTNTFSVIPGLHVLIDPSLNPTEDVIFVFAIRARVSF